MDTTKENRLFAVVIILYALIFVVGITQSITRYFIEKDAIKHGVGHFVIDEKTGDSTFEWKTK